MDTTFYRERIRAGLSQQTHPARIVREVYLSYPTFSFNDHPEKEFQIKDAISEKFGVDIFSVHFGGSAKTGESYHKENIFRAGRSDLDAAIISPQLFLKYLELTCEITRNFSDLTLFACKQDKIAQFRNYLQRGVFIPSLMPKCKEKSEWVTFFNNLSRGNTDIFENINCWIYSSQKTFELKFSKTIKLLDK